MNKYESPFSCIFSGVLSMLQMVYLFTLHHENESDGYSSLPNATAPECFAQMPFIGTELISNNA